MFSILSKSLKDASVLRRLEFAARFYPRGMHYYSESVVSFSVKAKRERNNLTVEQADSIIENLEMIDDGEFSSDMELTKEIVMMEKHESESPLGVVLVSSKTRCRNCESRLHIRADCSSKVTILR